MGFEIWNFNGGAFHPDFPKGKASGTLTVSDTAVAFECEYRTLQFSLIDLQISLGGAGDRTVFFKHPSQPDVSLYTLEHAVLSHPALVNDPAIGEQLKTVRRKKLNLWGVVAVLIMGAIGLGALLWIAKSPLAKVAAANVPPAWEVKLGDTVFEQLKVTQIDLVDDPALEAELARITEPLVKGIGSQRYAFQFHIACNKQVNAFAIPGGHVVIHTGLLEASDTPEEVVGVLAHEIAHVTRQHSLRNIFESAGIYLIVQTILGDASGIISVIAEQGTFLLSRKFSRDFEREADDEGWRYLEQANIDPRGLAEFFRKMKEGKGSVIQTAEKSLSILSTHPTDDERIARLEAKWKATSRKDGFLKFDMNYEDFKSQISKLK